jgi:tetratricopeptide (TPR) repeat protein
MRLQGRTAEARPFYQKALAIRLVSLGGEHAMTAKCYTGLADIERRDGHYAAAQTLIEKALTIQEKAVGAMHPSVADSLDVEGLNYFDQHKVDRARGCFARSFTIRKSILSPDHPDLLTSVFYLALCDQSLNRGAQSDTALQKSLDSLARVLGAKHPTVVMARGLSSNDQPPPCQRPVGPKA